MDPDRWRQVEQLYHAARECEPKKRAAFLTEACNGDQELRREVESLLAYDRSDQNLLDHPVWECATGLLTDPGAKHLAANPGQHFGDYEITELIGSGGMGDVFLAYDTRLRRRAALKILHSEYTTDPAWLLRFEREARSVAALNHPNIVTVYSVGQANGISFLATEFIEGKTLRKVMADGPAPPRMAIDTAVQAASALAAAHAACIVHRDIKPENMILRPDGLLKVLDFGLAKPLPRPTGSNDSITAEFKSIPGLIVGTLRYMSPEQANGAEADSRSDVFSLGCVLYELLTGRAAASGETPTEILASILAERPVPLKTLQPRCPVPLVRIVDRCLDKNPDERYPTGRELVMELQAAQSRLESGKWPALDRRGYRAAAVILAGLLLLAAVIFLVNHGFRGKSIESIAVLPLVNESGSELEYVADGLTDSLIGDLSQVPNLKVISRASVFRYKSAQIDPVVLGRALKAHTILSGRVSQRGERISVRLELADVRDGHRIWGEQYDRLRYDLVQLQGEISREVVSKLRLTLSRTTEREMQARQKVSSKAYDLYLKGRFLLYGLGGEADVSLAATYLHRALEENPNYTLASASLGLAYVQLADFVSPREAMPKAREYALEAIQRPGSPPEAHVALGLVKLLYDWDWLGADREFKADPRLNPTSIDVFSCYLHYADALGRTNEAVAGITHLVARDPMSPLNQEELGCVSYYARHYDTAIEQFRRTVAISPSLQLAYVNAGRSYTQKGMYPEAIAALEKARKLDPESPLAIGELGYVEAVSGNKPAARKIIDQLIRAAEHRYIDAYLIALIYLGLGDREKTFAYLEKAYQDRSSSMPWLKVEPKFDPVRSDPRYINLLHRVGFAS